MTPSCRSAHRVVGEGDPLEPVGRVAQLSPLGRATQGRRGAADSHGFMTTMRNRARLALGILALGSVVWAGAGCGTEKMLGSVGTGGAPGGDGSGGAAAGTTGHVGGAGGTSGGAGGTSASGLQFNGSISFFRVRP